MALLRRRFEPLSRSHQALKYAGICWSHWFQLWSPGAVWNSNAKWRWLSSVANRRFAGSRPSCVSTYTRPEQNRRDQSAENREPFKYAEGTDRRGRDGPHKQPSIRDERGDPSQHQINGTTAADSQVVIRARISSTIMAELFPKASSSKP